MERYFALVGHNLLRAVSKSIAYIVAKLSQKDRPNLLALAN